MVSLQGEQKFTIPLGSRMARRLEGCWQVVVDIKDASTFTSELAEHTPPKTNMSREKGSFQRESSLLTTIFQEGMLIFGVCILSGRMGSYLPGVPETAQGVSLHPVSWVFGMLLGGGAPSSSAP